MKFFKQLLAGLTMLCATQAFAGVELGKDYKLLNPAQPVASGKKIEVLEFFAYPCGHCFHLAPLLAAWEAKAPNDVQFSYVPVIFRDSWTLMAQTFYALEALGQHKKLHDELFKAWHVTNTDLSDEAKVTAYVAQRGVDRAKFSAALHSFAVQSKVNRSVQMLEGYQIRGTPTLVVDGKYAITGLGPEETIRALNGVIELARKDRGGKR
ncbi:MAG: thiol:disulfide interchange protein DsbA/DsbL [Pseudomonadota bacterium]|jgi:thiol:disulfide interchange protein DsbA